MKSIFIFAKLVTFVCLWLVFFSGVKPNQNKAASWIPLFNGKDLDGWKHVGDGTDYTEGDPIPERKFDFEPFRGARPNLGYIGLQNHGKDDVVYFKYLSFKNLKKK